MTAENVLTLVLLAAATAACLAVVWLAREAVATARSTRQLSDEVRERLIPLLDKADVTVDAANAELLRIDAAITRFEDASVRVSAASSTIADVVQAPADIVTGVADKVRRAWKDRRENAAASASTAAPAEDAGPDDADGSTGQSEIDSDAVMKRGDTETAIGDPLDPAEIQASRDV